MATDKGLREILLQFIGDFANWDVAAHKDYLAVARGQVVVGLRVSDIGRPVALVTAPTGGGKPTQNPTKAPKTSSSGATKGGPE